MLLLTDAFARRGLRYCDMEDELSTLAEWLGTASVGAVNNDALDGDSGSSVERQDMLEVECFFGKQVQ